MDNPNPAERAEFERQTNEMMQQYMDAYLARDVAGITDLFTDDVRFMPPGMPLQIGIKGFADFVKLIVSKGHHKLTLISQEKFGPVGDMAGERLIVQFDTEEGKRKWDIKALHVYKKVGNTWKIQYDCWNFDHPEPKA